MRRFSCVAIVDGRGWLLLQERDEHAPIDPERWGFPGGHVEPGEHPDDAAVRELAEETGLRLPSPPAHVGTWPVRHHDRPEGGPAPAEPDEVHLYAAAADLGDADITCGEGRRIVFVDPARARRLPLTGSAALILPAFLASAAYGNMRG